VSFLVGRKPYPNFIVFIPFYQCKKPDQFYSTSTLCAIVRLSSVCNTVDHLKWEVALDELNW